MPNRASLKATVISVDQVLYDLAEESTFRAFTKIKGGQGSADQPAVTQQPEP